MRIDLDKILIDEISTIRDSLESMEKTGAKICFVRDSSGKVVGSISDGDVRKALLKGATLATKASEIMNKNFIYVNSNESRMNVLDLMKSRNIGVIPILDKESKLIGVHTLYGLLGSEPKPNFAVIMAGGRGERLKPLTEKVPKPMITVAGKPILERIIHHLVGFGITNIIISVNYLKEKIIDYFENGERFGCRIEYVVEEKPLGTAGSLFLLKNKLKEDFLVLNGDLVTQADISDMLKFHREKNADITIGSYEYIYEVPFGVLKLKNGEEVEEIEEKPLIPFLISSGIYVLSVNILELLREEAFITMPELIRKALEEKKRVLSYEIIEEWVDVGMKKELDRARGKVD